MVIYDSLTNVLAIQNDYASVIQSQHSQSRVIGAPKSTSTRFGKMLQKRQSMSISPNKPRDQFPHNAGNCIMKNYASCNTKVTS